MAPKNFDQLAQQKIAALDKLKSFADMFAADSKDGNVAFFRTQSRCELKQPGRTASLLDYEHVLDCSCSLLYCRVRMILLGSHGL